MTGDGALVPSSAIGLVVSGERASAEAGGGLAGGGAGLGGAWYGGGFSDKRSTKTGSSGGRIGFGLA